MKPSLMSGSLVASLLLSGCANLTAPAPAADSSANSSTDIHKQYWAKYDHSIRPAPSVPLAGSAAAAAPEAARAAAASAPAKVAACAEPASDSALKLISRLEASIEKSAAAKTGGSGEFDASVVRLAERAQMLTFLRDSLYRICEQTANGQMTKEEASARYNKVMDSVHAIVETDRDLAKESAAKALKDLSPDQIKALR